MVLETFRLTNDFTWDRANGIIFDDVIVNQGDANGRKMRVQVVNRGAIENLTGAALNLAWKATNGKGLDKFTAVDALQGIFEISFTKGMLANAGRINASLQIILPSGGGIVESRPFVINNQVSVVDQDSAQSTDSWTALENALANAENLEAKYTQELLSLEQQLQQKENDIQQLIKKTGGIINVKEYKCIDNQFVKGDGVHDDTSGIQKAIDDAILLKGKLVFPTGEYVVTAPLNFSNIAKVSNSNSFGLTIQGDGMGTAIFAKLNDGEVLFNFDSTVSDIQVIMRDISGYDKNNQKAIFLILGKMSRYTVFENVRMYGFKEGIRARRECYAVRFINCTIRGCKYEAFKADEITLGVNQVLTEFLFVGGYIDNNGIGGISGGSYVPAMSFYNCQEFKFIGTVFEGNYGGGIHIRGKSENFIFLGTRHEETLVSFGVSGHIHSISTGIRNIKFETCEIAYNAKSQTGDKNYSLMNVGSKSQVVFENCQIIDQSNTNPNNVFGSSAPDAEITLSNCSKGIGDIYKVVIPNRYFNLKLGDNFLWSDGLKLRIKSSMPIDDSDGFVVGEQTT